MISWMEALPLPTVVAAAGEPSEPVVTAAMTWDRNDAGMPRATSRAVRLTVSWPFTIDPRMATPATAPSSRAVLLVDAAIPECSAGTLVRADEVTGTITIPKPMPAMARVHPTVDRPAWGVIRASVRKIPLAASAHPTTMGMRGPARDTHRPVNTEANTIPAVMGMKSRARWNGEVAPT